MGKDLNGKELGSGIYQRKDRIYVANVRCGGRTKSLYDTDPDNLKKRQAIFCKDQKWKGKKDHRGSAVSKIPGRTDGKYNGRHTTDE